MILYAYERHFLLLSLYPVCPFFLPSSFLPIFLMTFNASVLSFQNPNHMCFNEDVPYTREPSHTKPNQNPESLRRVNFCEKFWILDGKKWYSEKRKRLTMRVRLAWSSTQNTDLNLELDINILFISNHILGLFLNLEYQTQPLA